MAVKKKPVKKPAPPKPRKKEPEKVIIEIIIKNETVNPFLNVSGNKSLAVFTKAALGAEGVPDPNFEFKFTPVEGVRLSKIDIDGIVFRGPELASASKTDADGKLVVSVFADPMTTPVPMILEAVGEPNRALPFTLKFENKDVFKSTDDKKIVIAENRFGFLALPSVNLP